MPLPHIARSLALGASLALAATFPASAQDALERATVESETIVIDTTIDPEAYSIASEIVDIGYPEDAREALFFGTMDQTVSQLRSAIAPTLPQNDAGAMAIFDNWVIKYTEESKLVLRKHIPAIMSGMTEAYANIFSVKELTDILAFVQTPSGKKFFELSPAVMGEPSFANANQRYLDESMEMLVPAQEELLGELLEYMADQDLAEGATQS